MNRVQRGVILPVVLFVLLLIGLFAARFAFRVQADLAATQVLAYKLQTRLAAEAGVEWVKMLLAGDRLDMAQWYNNPKALHRIIVWTPDGETSVWGTNEELPEGSMAYRFSVVADDPTDDQDFIRFGVTDESSKLNLNTATERQLRILVEAALEGEESADPQGVVDAILDWRDPDRDPRGKDDSTEGEYYRSLDKPYRVKNGPFDTVEELLLVKGVTARLLYGEDVDRNGLLTANEDDGDSSFPPDNQDGRLNRGIYPYLTVFSYENDVDNNRHSRVNLLGGAKTIREELADDFENEPAIIDFLIASTRRAARGLPQPRLSRDVGTLRSGPGDQSSRGRAATPPSGADSAGGASGSGPGGNKEQQRRQYRQADPPDGGRANNPDGDIGNAVPGDSDPDPAGGDAAQDGESANPDEQSESNGGPSGPEPIRSPASLLGDQIANNGTVVPSLLRPEHMPILMDRTTVNPSPRAKVEGLINVNTAPVPVLRCIDGLTEEQIGLLVGVRSGLDSDTKATTAWLLTESVVDVETFKRVAPQITARGQQFTIEVLGYADHVGSVTRLQVVVDMVGPVPQIIYYRDLTYLGANFPIRADDLKGVRRAG